MIRREFRLAEGDPFNNVRVRRSRDRIQSLGFFQDNLEIQQNQGSAPDRVVLGVEVEERATGQLQLSAGYSSLESFLVNVSVEQRNFMGRGQEVRAAVNYSTYSKSCRLASPSPIFRSQHRVGFDCSGATITASISWATARDRPLSTEHTGQIRRRAAQ